VQEGLPAGFRGGGGGLGRQEGKRKAEEPRRQHQQKIARQRGTRRGATQVLRFSAPPELLVALMTGGRPSGQPPTCADVGSDSAERIFASRGAGMAERGTRAHVLAKIR